MHFLICKSKIARSNATGRLSHAFIYEQLPTTFLAHLPAEGSINCLLSVRESIREQHTTNTCPRFILIVIAGTLTKVRLWPVKMFRVDRLYCVPFLKVPRLFIFIKMKREQNVFRTNNSD